MSNDLKATKGVTNFARRTWDKKEFAAKAKERAERTEREEAAGAALADGPSEAVRAALAERAAAAAAADGGGASSSSSSSGGIKESDDQHSLNHPMHHPAPLGAAGPLGSKRAWLKSRDGTVELDGTLHKTKIVTSATANRDKGAYWCPVCECQLRDSLNYLDHINGRKHQRRLGFSMRVERSSVDSVRARFGTNLQKRKRDEQSQQQQQQAAGAGGGAGVFDAYQRRLAEQAAEEERAKRRRKEEAKAAKKAAKRAAKEEAAAEDEQADPDQAAMMAMMGFSGFGSSGQN